MTRRDAGGVGSARRRRDRHLRAWHHHVKLTVAIELATAVHHSSGLVRSKVEKLRVQEAGVLNTPTGQTTPSQGLREVAQPLPLPHDSLVNCHAPSLAVPQLVEVEENVQADFAMFQRLWIDSRLFV